jgi:hypothetical protein
MSQTRRLAAILAADNRIEFRIGINLGDDRFATDRAREYFGEIIPQAARPCARLATALLST